MWFKETAQGSRGALGPACVVQYTEGCRYKYVLCDCICKDLCKITKNVQQVRFRTCSSLFLLIAIIFQHSPKNVDAFVPNWHEYKYKYFVLVLPVASIHEQQFPPPHKCISVLEDYAERKILQWNQ